ncbi:MAG: hypothetical protein M1834_001633 [Cirrosporium novae-zelandiae]|nr:MAG: hypothetical protein M1834_004150 [Cirrosporium novae-zelandiae]KAI9735617.1 MAG: hypothetical protein M1834_001633 [Cirrosporium novae-zelandiae]
MILVAVSEISSPNVVLKTGLRDECPYDYSKQVNLARAKLTEEKSKFHSVSSDQKGGTTEQRENNITGCSSNESSYSFIPYKSPGVPADVGDTEFEPPNSLRTVLSVPQDGRIKLAFDLNWQLKLEKFKWTLEHLFDTALFGQDERTVQECLQPTLQGLKNFHKNIQDFGDFFILDVDPLNLEYGHVIYRIEGTMANYCISQDKMPREMR